MIRTILYREIYDGLNSFTFLSTLVLLTVLVPLSAYTQARYFKQVVADYAVRQSIHQQENNNRAIVLTRSVPPLLPLFNGVYDRLPDEILLRTDSVSRGLSSEDVRPLDWLSQRIDLGMIIGVLMTLMASLLGHDVVTGERERGTLKLILTSPIPKYKVLAAKLIAVTGLMCLSLVYTVLLYIFVLVISGNGAMLMSTGRAFELIIIALIAMLTIMVFVVLSITISATVKYSSVALTLSIAVWALTVLIWPTLGPYVASSLWPVPPRQVTQREVFNREAQIISAELSDHKKAAEEVMARNTDVKTAWKQYLDIKRRWIERRRAEVETLLGEREKQVRNQQAGAKALLSISPYGAFEESMGLLCGTGVEDYNLFIEAAERYEENEFLTASFASLAQEKPWVAKPEDTKPLDLPPFEVPAQPLAARLKEAITPLAWLITEIGLLLLIGFVKFARYDMG